MVAIDCQTTDIDPPKSARQISKVLQENEHVDCTEFTQRFDDGGALSGISFTLRDEALGKLPITLTAQTGAVERVLREETNEFASKSGDEYDRLVEKQADRIAWRHLKKMVEATVIAIAHGVVSPSSAFMGWATVRDPETGEGITMAEFLRRHTDAISFDDPNSAFPSTGRRLLVE